MPHNTLEANRIQKERQRLKERLEKEEEISRDIANLNFGMKPLTDSFPTMDDYLSANPDKTPTDYIHLKIAWQKESAENEHDFENRELKEAGEYGNLERLDPKNRHKCIQFRKAWMTNDPSLGVIHQAHNCKWCDSWLVKYKKTVALEGCNLW